jgi:hypothetical protein
VLAWSARVALARIRSDFESREGGCGLLQFNLRSLEPSTHHSLGRREIFWKPELPNMVEKELIGRGMLAE